MNILLYRYLSLNIDNYRYLLYYPDKTVKKRYLTIIDDKRA